MTIERKDRTGQRVQICYQPLIVAEVTGWDEETSLWRATVVTPPLETPMAFREAFLAYLDAPP